MTFNFIVDCSGMGKQLFMKVTPTTTIFTTRTDTLHGTTPVQRALDICRRLDNDGNIIWSDLIEPFLPSRWYRGLLYANSTENKSFYEVMKLFMPAGSTNSADAYKPL